MRPAEYRRIGQDLVDELVDGITQGENAVILGPYYGGKTHLLRRIKEQLEEKERLTPLFVQFFSDRPTEGEKEVRQRIRDAARDAQIDLKPVQGVGQLLLEDLRRESTDRIILLVSSINGLGDQMRQFVGEMLQLSAMGQLIFVMSGEAEILEVVSGPRPVIREGRLVVLQGLDRVEFTNVFEQKARDFSLGFESPIAAGELLWTLTGGSTTLALRFARELSLQFSGDARSSITLTQIERLAELEVNRGVNGAPVLARAVDLISTNPGCWKDLELLAREGAASVEGSTPTPLELAGVAVRDYRLLKCSSIMLQRFLAVYYDDNRLGDLYASNGQWETALDFYRRVPRARLTRPRHGFDVAILNSVVNAVCADMHARVGEIRRESDSDSSPDPASLIGELRRLFTQACEYVLGFPQVTFWRRAPHADWELNEIDCAVPSELQKELKAKVGEFVDQALNQIVECDHASFLTAMPGLRRDHCVAVLIGATQLNGAVMADRQRLLRQLLTHFVKAHEHAMSLIRKRLRYQIENRMAEVSDEVIRGAIDSRMTTDKIVERVAETWASLVFSRVLVSLRNPEGSRLMPTYANQNSGLNPLLPYLEVDLTTSGERQLERVVFEDCEPKVADAAEDQRVSPSLAALGMRTFAVIPIVNARQQSIGIILLERSDRSRPTRQELTQLVHFAGQLAAAIEHTERASRFDLALKAIPEPTVFLDTQLRTEYASEAAATLFQIAEGWRHEDDKRCDLQAFPAILNCARQSLYTSTAMVYQDHLGAADWTAETVATRMHDWRGQIIGTLLFVRNYSQLSRAVNALGTIAEAETIGQAKSLLLKAAQELGFESGRLYVPSLGRSDYLESEDCFGLAEDLTNKIHNRGIVLSSRTELASECWLCIEKGEPVLFCYKPELPYGNVGYTKYGLKYITVQNPSAREDLQKEPGQFWVDFPLKSNTKLIGKVSLMCDDSLLPQQFRLLTLLTALYPRLFDTITLKEKGALIHDQEVRQEAAERTINAVAHSLKNIITPLCNVLNQDLMKLETKAPELQHELHIANAKLSSRLSTAMATIDRVYTAFGTRQPRVDEEFDIVEAIRAHVGSSRKDIDFSIEANDQPSDVKADRHQILLAVDELIQNSIDAQPVGHRPAIRMDVVVFREGSRDYVRVVYRDNGPGIPVLVKRDVFEPLFTYSHPGAQRIRGSGVGLSVVQRVVQDHDGFITESGEPGKGVEFKIEFPRLGSKRKGS